MALDQGLYFVSPKAASTRDARGGGAGVDNGYDIRTLQDLLGHSPRELTSKGLNTLSRDWVCERPSAWQGFISRGKDVSTTQIYTHVMQRPGLWVRSPLDG